MKPTWKDATLAAIMRFCKHKHSQYFTNQELERWELDTIRQEVKSTGCTPRNTMDRILQELVANGKIERVEPGLYKLIKD